MSNRRPGVFDTGATHTEGSTKFEEAVIALRYGLTLKEVFVARGQSVFMTRDDDEDHTPVGQRAGNAERAGADVFISLHLNDADDDSARGLEVLFRGEDDKPLAQALQDKLVAVTGFRDRKIKPREDLAVLKFDGPAVLIELGFIANDGDRNALINPATRTEVCEAIATVTIAQMGGGTGGGGVSSKAKVNVSSGDTLNVRAAPKPTAKIIAKLSSGSEVEIFAQSGIWRRIHATAERWVSSKFLTPI